ncbi:MULTISPECIES: ABC transporter ATP-binding protein [Cupriavidus]|jgi:NitT/TauT family transport system ATP-binding protein|uniref:ABC transporter ATP-binding protein n=1 Tax=Cupriavidus pauculus TaxID=82633 RepID=A0A5P2H7W2_9BURK|nr:ABC transporter ATP-binding protein [Cupriavidus pauculus]QET04247.1 ABC transporter ATP-binding protein [Cupriavidus pauculus]
MNTLLSLKGIKKSFQSKGRSVDVLGGLTFDVNEQDFVSIIGPSGCGKTTVFNIIAGLIDPDTGEISYRGQQVTGLRGKVGYMMQRDLLFPWRTVLENVMLAPELQKLPLREARENAMEYLNTFGLAGFDKAYPKTLSGGMRQRVALIRTLISDPDVLLLDEPFSALDYQTRLYLESVLLDAVDTFKKTVILVTHDIDEAVALSKRVVVLAGKPSHVKHVYDIDINEKSPIGARSHANFSGYFHQLCAELDIQTRKH